MTKEQKVIIEIDITDWDEEWQISERKIVDKEDIVRLAKEGVKPMELARNTISSRERGLAKPDIIRDNKGTFNLGGSFQVSQIIARWHKNYNNNTKNDKEIRARALVCETDNDGNPNAVDSDTEQGCQRAISYLNNAVIGHIKSRLNIIALTLGKDGVLEYSEQLIVGIREVAQSIVDKLE